MPKLFEERGADDTVRVWVPGCATGEEVFSIAILLREHMDRLAVVPRVQIFATDIDEHALAVARAARIRRALLDSVSPERRERFFIPDGGSYVGGQGSARPVHLLAAQRHSRPALFAHRPGLLPQPADLFRRRTCRDQVIPTFHYALRPDGYLFLGTSENVSQFDDLFAPVDKKHRIFRRRSDVAPRPAAASC